MICTSLSKICILLKTLFLSSLDGVIFISTLALCASDRGLCHDRDRGCHSTSIFFVSCNLQITTLPCPILSCRGIELGSFVQVFPYPVDSRKTYNAAPNLTRVR
ncbi:hypothetical protein DER46DRAFT_240146 [Fusarium sp. MPI-SDFR-AT-0072]|nr:hypothetical protein DER46DRAFT_240146 [Fusarium sp. MPI-SDFR-AT-0072]